MTPEQFTLLNLVQGTLIRLEWLDIYEDSIGDPRKASLGVRNTYTAFWETRDSHGLPCIVTTNTIDKGNPEQQGWCCTPLACVLKVEVIRRPRAKRQRKPAEVKP